MGWCCCVPPEIAVDGESDSANTSPRLSKAQREHVKEWRQIVLAWQEGHGKNAECCPHDKCFNASGP
eukprot:scaffold1475_cov111-Cylindrotheca_fusiformis.AAC.8